MNAEPFAPRRQFQFLSTQEFSELTQSEKVAYLSRAVQELREMTALLQRDAEKKAPSQG